MSSDQDLNANLPAPQDSSSLSNVPIANPNDLMGEALKRMSPDQQQKLMAKAGDELLRLEVMRKEAELHREGLNQDVDSLIDSARSLEGIGADYQMLSEKKTQYGRTEVRINKKGFCFVATACYGDYEHPMVRVLHNFRDEILSSNRTGRRFICWYYKNGPSVADYILARPLMCWFTRLTLTLLAVFIVRPVLHVNRKFKV